MDIFWNHTIIKKTIEYHFGVQCKINNVHQGYTAKIKKRHRKSKKWMDSVIIFYPKIQNPRTQFRAYLYSQQPELSLRFQVASMQV